MTEQSVEHFKKTFRTNLEEFRKDQGLTQIELSEKSGFEASYVGKLERGDANPSLESIRKLCGTLQVEPEELLLPPAERPDPDETNTESRMKVQEVELEMQKEELDRKTQRLQEERDHFRNLFAKAPRPLATVDGRGHVINVNEEFQRKFGSPGTGNRTQHINSFLDPDDRDDFYRYRTALASGEAPDPLVLEFQLSDDTLRSFHVTASRPEADEELLLLSLVDVANVPEA